MSEERDRSVLESFNTDSPITQLEYPRRGLGFDDVGLGHHMIFDIFEIEGLCFETLNQSFSSAEQVSTSETENTPILDGISTEDAISTSNDTGLAGIANNITDGGALRNLSSWLSTNFENFKGLSQESSRIQEEGKKLKGSIALYVPEAVNVSYGLDWQMSDDMVGVALLEDVFKLIQSSGGASTEKIAKSIGEQIAIQAAPNVIDSIGSLVGVNFGGQAAVESLTRKVRNPHIAFLFKGVNQRSFTFEFNFTPQNFEEAKDTYNIIKMFKKHAMPELDDSKRFLSYPSLFEITYFSQLGVQNKFVNKLKPCVITAINVDYSGGGTYSTFEDSSFIDIDGKTVDGAPPTNVKLSLTFSETSLLTRGDIDEGY